MNNLTQKIENKTATIGMGYVGLPLSVEFAKHFKTIGFDINENRIDELKAGTDKTLEVSQQELENETKLNFTTDPNQLESAEIYIVTVPTPIDNQKQPDLTPLQAASNTTGNVLSKDNIVIYESTVYPGATEEVCVPILEKASDLTKAGMTIRFLRRKMNEYEALREKISQLQQDIAVREYETRRSLDE